MRSRARSRACAARSASIGSSDIFEAKQAFATASRSDSQTPSAAADVLGVTVTNAAQATSHTVQVQQIAAAHKVASTSISGALDDALALSGSFAINGQTITVDAGDSLLDLRDRINAANAGADATGTTASIVSISASEHVLILTADATGTDCHDQRRRQRRQRAPGPRHRSTAAAPSRTSCRSRATPSCWSMAWARRSSARATPSTTSSPASPSACSRPSPARRSSLDVERDLNQVKSAIVDFVDAYNELRSFINQQSLTDVPEDDETGAGILAGTSALSETRSRLSAAVGAAVDGSDPTFAVLAQIGITFRSAGQVADPLLASTLEIDETKLDDALLNQTDAVRGLFAFELSSSSADAALVGFDGNTSFSADGYTLNVAYAGGAIVSANIDGPADGSDDGSVVVNGKVLKVVAGGAQGLQLLYTGTSAASGIRLDLSVGIGAKMYGALDALVDETSGLIANEIGALEGQNQLGEDRIQRMQERLDRERERLLERFVAMETALTTMNRLLDSLRQQINSAFNNDRR